MREAFRWDSCTGRICKIVLLGLVTTLTVTPGGVVALGQTGTGNPAETLSYMPIDLNPGGFTESGAFGVSDGQQVGWGRAPSTGCHGLVWRGTPSSVVELHTPAGFECSEVRGTSGGQHVGAGSGPATGRAFAGFNHHALLWRAIAGSVVDLNPRGFTESWAFGISHGEQVGYARGPATGGRTHALLWRGTAASVVDLNPSGFTESWAFGISGGHQVGWGSGPSTGIHALLWRGTAASVVDLHPHGFVQSWAYGVSDGQQAGFGWGPATGGDDCPHALLWHGNAASVVDLNPTRVFACSQAYGTSGGQQVGFGYGPATGATGERSHALLWRGSAASVVDLHAFLPPGFEGSVSRAYGIDPDGNIIGDAVAQRGVHAFLWVPIRKPGHR